MATWAIDLHKLPITRLDALAEMQPRVARMSKVLGLRSLAALLDTDSSNLSKFIAGKRTLPSEIAKRVLDLDHVLARAMQIFQADVLVDWLEGTEPTFGFARPIDVLAVRGSAPLLEVLDRIEAGAGA